ncbi:MAG: shikimate dehydrogenase family protein [Lacibacter sp.]
MRQFGLIGYPLTHSFSARYFAQKFEREQITGCAYDLYPLEHIGELPALLQRIPHLCGLNVTIPYKEAVLPFLTGASAAVHQTGACNCIRIESGKCFGFNTDVIGFEATLKPLLQPRHTHALVLGTGGAAKAVAWVLQQLGINYQFVSRTPQANQLEYTQLNEALLQKHLLIINTTPLGMQPRVDTCPSVPFAWIGPQHLCIDLVYNPPQTLFLQRAAERGAVTANGALMLEVQAEASWKVWNDAGFMDQIIHFA